MTSKMPQIFKPAAEFVLDIIYPPRCPLCDGFVTARDKPCDDCAASLQILEADAYLPHLHKQCFTRCRSRFAYDGRLKDALHGFKYSERLDLVRYFVEELGHEARAMADFNLVVPVPLHPKRLRERGFNQSALLARLLGKNLEIEVELDALKRAGDIRPQVGLERDARIANVRGAFEVDFKMAHRIAEKNILLIDDVMTTGATVNECARTLIKSGATSVFVLTVARTL